nr:DUF6879 family protein [Murinocardiopsis flavida]
MSYRIRGAMGENVEVMRIGSDATVPNDEIFDFLLFDRDVALVHDYGQGPTGVQTGGWLVRDTPSVRRLESRALALRREAEPLERFMTATDL